MAKIYSLETDGVIWYVGSTPRPLCKRLAEHRYRNTVNFDEFDIEIKLLEVCKLEDRFHREQYWITALAPFYNKGRPGILSDVSRNDYQRQWSSTHLDKVKEYGKRYRTKLKNKLETL